MEMETPRLASGTESTIRASPTGHTMADATPWKARTRMRPVQWFGIVNR